MNSVSTPAREATTSCTRAGRSAERFSGCPGPFTPQRVRRLRLLPACVAQYHDQVWQKGNLCLALNCSLGIPVRVIRKNLETSSFTK